ncbi:MAG: EF-P lysine aminoacylase EpmA [Candidatus Paceibacterota bacterium]|jgi:lysyl-tRNA synthetase class 2
MKKIKEIKEIQIKRTQILDLTRDFFKKRGFLEVQTPILTKDVSTEPYIDPISVKFSDDRNKTYYGYLTTSPEYSLKKLLALGFDKIFEITKAFRQKEALGGLHNPEFTILEWYKTNDNYRHIMKDTEELVYYLVKKLHHHSYFFYQGQKIDVSLPWLKVSMKQVFKKYARIDLDKTRNLKYLKTIIKQRGYHLSKNCDWNDLFYLIFLNEIEPRLPKDRAIILYDYPLPQAALAKRKNKKSFYAERFETYIGGMEISNAFSELLDWREQLKRLKEDQILRKKLHKEKISIDKSFIQALKLNIPDSGGNALGIDRLQMLLLDIKDIDELLPFSIKQMFK